LIGDAGSNVLSGGNGNDVLIGLAGDDVLIGGAGSNTLQGGVGNDRYIVTSATDSLIEFADEGIDTVETTLSSYTLKNHFEHLVFTGNGAFTGSGNAHDNVITGGAGNDILRGMGGNDTLNGGLGNDEARFRGSKAEYTVTAEGTGYRVFDNVAGRDGSTLVESIETLRFMTGNTTTVLSYPPAVTGALEPSDKGFVGPQVQPFADDDFILPTDFDGPEVMPAVFDDGGLPGGFDPAGDPSVLTLLLELEANPMVSYGPRGPYLIHEENIDVAHPSAHFGWW
jgi:hypothetical protein